MRSLLRGFMLTAFAAMAMCSVAIAQDGPQSDVPVGSVTDYRFQPRIHSSVDTTGCKCMDITFIIDDTGSMGGAINNVKLGLVDILNTANVVSCGDLRVSLITFKDDVTVHSPLTANIPLVVAQINALVASGGANGPEAHDEALREAVEAAGTVCTRTGRFNINDWRSSCCKIVILVTDNLPAGCDDAYTGGVDDVNAHLRALSAAGLGVKIGALQVGGIGGVAAIMQDYAATTTGLYAAVPASGAGTADAMKSIITNCVATPIEYEDCCVRNGAGGCFTVLKGTCSSVAGGSVTTSCAAQYCPTPATRSSWSKVKHIYR